MGDVIELSRHGRPVSAPTALEWVVDDWGRDDVLARTAARLLRLRWDTACGGLEHLPAHGPALVVVNSQRFGLTPWWVALVLSAEVGRPVRFVGRPDTPPFGPIAGRLGGLLARPDELRSALRQDQLLLVGLTGTLDQRRAGSCDPRLLAPAVEQGAPVLPAAAAASDLWRAARIDVAPPITPSRHRRRTPADAGLAHQVEDVIGRLLGSFGGAHVDLGPVLGLLRRTSRDT